MASDFFHHLNTLEQVFLKRGHLIRILFLHDVYVVGRTADENSFDVLVELSVNGSLLDLKELHFMLDAGNLNYLFIGQVR